MKRLHLTTSRSQRLTAPPISPRSNGSQVDSETARTLESLDPRRTDGPIHVEFSQAELYACDYDEWRD